MAYEDLKEAIRTHALFTADSGARIIATDGASRGAWMFDFRALLLQPKWLKRYAEIFWEQYGSKYPFQVCGMESAAISLVAAVLMEGEARGKPVNGLYVRKSRKHHGLMKQVEGTPTKDPVILVDDLINSGKTFEKQVRVLEREGLKVSDLFAILAVSDKDAYADSFAKSIPLRALFSLEEFGLSNTFGDASKKTQLTEVWRFAAPNPSFNYVLQKSAPVLDEQRAYVGSDTGMFYALDQRDGSPTWAFEIGPHLQGKGIFSSPALHDDLVYFGAYDGNVYALNKKTGAVKWTYGDADWVGSSPALAPDKGLLFIGLEFGLFRKLGGIVALNMDTGARVWQHRTSEFTHGTPLYIKEKNMVVVGSNDDTVYAYRADSGEPVWQYRTDGPVKSSFTYDARWKLIVFGSLGGLCYALSTEGVPVFAHELGAGVYSTPLIEDHAAFVASLDKHLYAIELPTGKLLWKYATRGRIFSSPIMVEGLIYLGSNDGCLHEIDPKSGTGGVVFQATDRIVNRIAYNKSTQRFFVGTDANELYCLQRPH